MDLTGVRFGKLTAHSEVDKDGFVLCECDCGDVRLVKYGNLKSGNTRSCGKKGCRMYGGKPATYEHKKYNPSRFAGIDKVFGTSLGRIASKAISKNNKTGVRGVWFNEKTGKYEAYLYFQGKKIHLGCYDRLAEAAAEREKAEQTYYAPVLMECANYALS